MKISNYCRWSPKTTLMDKWLHFVEIALEPAGFPLSPLLPHTELPGRHLVLNDCLVGWKCCQAFSSRAIIAECFSAPHVASPIGTLKVQFETWLASWITAYSSNSPLKILANRISFRTTRCLQPVDLVNHIHLCLLEDSELRWKLGTLKIFGW